MTVQRKKFVGAVAAVLAVSSRVCRCVAVGISIAYPKVGIAGIWLRANRLASFCAVRIAGVGG
jgi:hypothetical protein